MIGKTVSHYKIIEKLGEGGMGVVYKAQDLKLDRFVALKFLPLHLSAEEEEKKRFIHEARAASALDHPNICTIFEIDETEEGQLFIAMAFYEGEALKERIEGRPLPIDEAVGIAIQIAQGLLRVHEKDIFHRDIKPGNIIITTRGEVKIVDFGLAKLSGWTLTKEGVALGTLAYMSPEQTQGIGVDHRIDIWSLGVVLYEMLAGEPPFKGDYEQAVVYSIMNEDPPPITDVRNDVSEGLVQLIGTALQKEPADRYQEMADLVTALETLSSNLERGVKAKPIKTKLPVRPSNKNRIRRFFESPWRLALIAIFALFIVFIWHRLSSSPISLSPSDYVVIAEFENRTNEEVLEHSLTEALRVTLRQSAHVNLLSRYRVANALQRMKLPPNQTLDETTALAVAQREGARVVITGYIDQLGTNYVLTSKIIDVSAAETVRLRRGQVRRIEDVLSAIDKLAKDIREDLGESLSLISRSDMPLAKVTTPSIKALELYSRANLLEAQGKYAEAIELKEQALDIDSLFAMVISDLSYDYRKIGNHEMALSYHNRVLPLLDRVTDRERLQILTIYYGPTFELDYHKAFQNARQWILLYPNDTIGHATLGHLAMFVGDYEIALRGNERALELDSSLAGTCYSNSGFAQALSGNAEEAQRLFLKSKKIRPAYLALDGYIAQVQWMKGELDSAEQTFRSILPLADPMRKMKTYAHLAALYHFQGQLQNALAQCRAGINLCRVANLPGEEAYFHYLSGEIARERGQTANFIKEMNEAVRLSTSPFLELPLVGSSFAKMGLREKAEQILVKLLTVESRDPYFIKRRSSLENYIRGEMALANNRHETAIQFFNQVGDLHKGDPIYLMAQTRIAFETAMNSNTKAIGKYLEILEKRGEIFMAFLPSVRNGGFWTSRLWTEVIFELGRLYAKTHQTELAVKYLNAVLDYWKKADNDYQKALVALNLLSEVNNTYSTKSNSQ